MATDTIPLRQPRTRARLVSITVGEADADPYDVLVLCKTDDASEAQADDLQAVFRVMIGLMRKFTHGKLILHVQEGGVLRITKEESIVIK